MKPFKLPLTTLFFALSALLATGCTSEDSDSNNIVTVNKITAKCAAAISFDYTDSSQIYLANGWPDNAEISILKSGTSKSTCIGTLTATTGGETADFTGRIDLEVGEYYLAIYPSIAVGESYVYDTTSTQLTISSEQTNLEAIEAITKFYPVSFYITSDGTTHKTLEFEHQYTFFTFYTAVPNPKYQDRYENADKLSLYTYDENGEQFRASVTYYNNSDDLDSTLLGFFENPNTDYGSDTPSRKIYLAVPDQIGEQALRWVLEDTQGGTNSEPLYYQDDTETSYYRNKWAQKYILGSYWDLYSSDNE